MQPPHVLVFANQAPDMNRLTKDRRVVVNLDEEVYGDPVLLKLKEDQERREVIAGKRRGFR